MDNSIIVSERNVPDNSSTVSAIGFVGSGITAQDFFSWAQSVDVGSKETIVSYSRYITRFGEYLQDNGITRPTREDIIAYRDCLKQTKKPATVFSYMTAVKLFFKWTEDQGVYPNVAKLVKNVNVPAGFKKDALTLNQIKEVLTGIDLSTINGVRDYALILLMVTTGLREVSVMQADIGDFETKAFDDEDSTEVFYKDVLFYKSKGHDDKDLFVIVPPITKIAIEDYLEQRLANGGSTKTTDPLFTSLSNHNHEGRLTTRSIRRIVTNHFHDAELDLSRISTHSLRHTFATINLKSGGTLEETQKALGHKNINTTMLYNHALTEANNPSANRVADTIFGKNN